MNTYVSKEEQKKNKDKLFVFDIDGVISPGARTTDKTYLNYLPKEFSKVLFDKYRNILIQDLNNLKNAQKKQEDEVKKNSTACQIDLRIDILENILKHNYAENPIATNTLGIDQKTINNIKTLQKTNDVLFYTHGSTKVDIAECLADALGIKETNKARITPCKITKKLKNNIQKNDHNNSIDKNSKINVINNIKQFKPKKGALDIIRIHEGLGALIHAGCIDEKNGKKCNPPITAEMIDKINTNNINIGNYTKVSQLAGLKGYNIIIFEDSEAIPEEIKKIKSNLITCNLITEPNGPAAEVNQFLGSIIEISKQNKISPNSNLTNQQKYTREKKGGMAYR